MNFKKDLEEVLKEKSDMTQKSYISRISALKKLIEYEKDDLEFLKNDKKIIKFIDNSDLKSSSKKLTYIALAVISELMKLENKKKYYDKMLEYKDINNKERNDNIISDEVTKNWATMDEIRSMFEKMPENTPEETQEKLIIGLYVLMPPLRNDFVKVRVFSRDVRKYEGNYILNKKNKIDFYLSEYKTANKYGTVIYTFTPKINPELYRLFKKHFENNNSNYLFVKFNDDQKIINDKMMSKLIPTIFEKYLNKHITIQLLRLIYETELQQDDKYLKMSNNEREKLHRELLHSTGVAQEYRKINTKNKNNIV